LEALPTNVTPMGNVSVNDAKLAAEPLVLPKVMVRSELLFTLTVAGEKVLLSVGAMLAGARMVKVSLAAGAVPLSVTKEAVVFTWGPTTDEVTFAVTVQEPLAGIEPPVKVTVVASFVIVPPQPLLLALPTNVTPLGNVSANDVVKLAAALLGLLKVMVRVDVFGTGPPVSLMLLGLKALMSVGGTGATEHAEGVIWLLIIVTAPLPFACIPARSLPDTFAPLLRLMLVCARIVPMN
jgi:hypothetical protein